MLRWPVVMCLTKSVMMVLEKVFQIPLGNEPQLLNYELRGTQACYGCFCAWPNWKLCHLETETEVCFLLGDVAEELLMQQEDGMFVQRVFHGEDPHCSLKRGPECTNSISIARLLSWAELNQSLKLVIDKLSKILGYNLIPQKTSWWTFLLC